MFSSLIKKICLLILLIALGLFFYWNTFNAPFERDEGEYAYSAWILQNGDAPYENSFLQKPPMIIYTYLVAQLINPDAVWPPRIIAFVFTLLTAILIGLIVKKEYGNKAGIIALLLFIPMNAFAYLGPFSANTERFMQLPMVGVLAIYVYFRKSSSAWPWFFAGLLAATAILYKQLCLFALAFIFAYWLAEKLNLFLPLKKRVVAFIKKTSLLFSDEPEKIERFKLADFARLKYILPLCLGIFLGAFLILGQFIFSGKFSYLWESAFVFNRYCLAQNDFFQSIQYFHLFWEKWIFLCFLIIWFFLRRPKKYAFYLLLFFISILSITTSPLPHYFLLVIPAWTIISGGALGDIVSLLDKNTRQWQMPALRYLPLTIILTLSLFIIAIPVRKQFAMNPDQINVWVYGYFNPFDEARLVGEKIKQITSPDDKVFIAGSETEILFYAKRKSSSRFVITYPFILNTPFREKYQRTALAELQKNPPAAIVFSNLEASGFKQKDAPQIMPSYINNLLKNDYALIGAFIRNPDLSGYWQDAPLKDDQMQFSTLLLYKKK